MAWPLDPLKHVSRLAAFQKWSKERAAARIAVPGAQPDPWPYPEGTPYNVIVQYTGHMLGVNTSNEVYQNFEPPVPAGQLQPAPLKTTE